MKPRTYKAIRNTFFVVLLIFLWLSSGSNNKKNKDMLVDQEARVQVVQSVAVGYFGEEVLSGITRAEKAINIKAEVSGTVLERVAEEGKMVNKGTVLMKMALDQRDIDAKKAKTEYDSAKQTYNSVKELYNKNLRSSGELLKAESSYQSAGVTYERALKALKDTNIQAPFKGVLERYLVEKGDFVSVGSNVIRFLDLEKIYLVVAVSDIKRSMLTLGSPAKVIFSNGMEVIGRVSYVGSEANETLHTFTVEVEIVNENYLWAPGTRATAILPLKEQLAHYISASILTLNTKGEQGVKIVDENNIIHFYNIQVVGGDDKGVWVSGLPESVRVIVVGQEYVKEGNKVEAVEAQLPQPKPNIATQE